MHKKRLLDHIEGGFFRYCIDNYWDIPHFEKMLYDNGQLISVFSNYDLIIKKNIHKKLVEKTIDFWLNIKAENNFFPSSIDADNIDGEELLFIQGTTNTSEVLTKKNLSTVNLILI